MQDKIKGSLTSPKFFKKDKRLVDMRYITGEPEANSASFSQIKTIGIHEQIVNQILKMVMDGELKRGEKLPSERSLKEQFNVSRASLREALRILKTMGIIEIKPGSGIFITKQDEQSMEMPLSLMFMPTCTKDIIELLEFRRLVECECIKTAVNYFTDSDLEQLKKCIFLAENPKSEISVAADRDFHYLIARKSGKKVFYESMSAMMMAITEAFKLMRGLDDFHKISMKSHEEHLAILEAIQSKDSKNAEIAMYKHLTSVQQDLEEVLKQ